MEEKYEEILEAIWRASEIKEYSVEAIKKDCAVEFSIEDLDELVVHASTSLLDGVIAADPHGGIASEWDIGRRDVEVKPAASNAPARGPDVSL